MCVCGGGGGGVQEEEEEEEEEEEGNKRRRKNNKAISTFSPVGSLSSTDLRMRVCVCLCIALNELIRGYASVVCTLPTII